MKSLNRYINEAAELELIKTEYREYGVVTLVRREDIDCANISKEDFVKFIGEDLKTAVDEYCKIAQPINDQRKKELVERDVEAAIKFAEKKWKTAKKRNEYIENARKNSEAKKWWLDDPKRIFFDFKPDKGDMGINDVCILRGEGTNEQQLEKCYEEVKDSKYFKKATGWAFKYESRQKDKISTYAFRPYVDLLLDESTRAEQKRDEEKLANAIQSFYSNSDYWGD